MNPHVVNELELIMLMIYVVARIAGTFGIIWIIAASSISNGWKVVIIVLTVIIGLGFTVRYHNPNSLHSQCIAEPEKKKQVPS